MLLKFHTIGLGLACLFLAACGGGGGGGNPITPTTPTPTPIPTASPTPSPITITNSGSTNTAKYTIVVSFNDSYTLNGSTGSTALTAASVSTLFSDVEVYTPLSNVITDNGCTKSASYGTTTMLSYDAFTSGDVSCPPSTSSPAQTLYTDAENIEDQLGLHN